MLGSIGVRIAAVVVVLALVAGLATAGYLHYTSMVTELASKASQITELRVQVAQERANVQEAIKVNRMWAEEARKTEETLRRLAQNQSDAAAETRRLNEVLARHNLSRLAAERPVLLERRINAGSDRIIRLLTEATGAKRPAKHPTGTPD